jgi:hypothetical protein
LIIQAASSLNTNVPEAQELGQSQTSIRKIHTTKLDAPKQQLTYEEELAAEDSEEGEEICSPDKIFPKEE